MTQIKYDIPEILEEVYYKLLTKRKGRGRNRALSKIYIVIKHKKIITIYK